MEYVHFFPLVLVFRGGDHFGIFFDYFKCVHLKVVCFFDFVCAIAICGGCFGQILCLLLRNCSSFISFCCLASFLANRRFFRVQLPPCWNLKNFCWRFILLCLRPVIVLDIFKILEGHSLLSWHFLSMRACLRMCSLCCLHSVLWMCYYLILLVLCGLLIHYNKQLTHCKAPSKAKIKHIQNHPKDICYNPESILSKLVDNCCGSS